jgi:DNA-binding CsgD family transcriptional regulator
MMVTDKHFITLQEVHTRYPMEASISNVIDAIGYDSFAPQLLDFLHNVCGADHYAAFELGADSLRRIESASFDGTQTANQQAALYMDDQYWRRDPTIQEARRRLSEPKSSVLKVDIRSMSDSLLRDAVYPHVSERLVVCGQRDKGAFGISVIRSTQSGSFSDSQVEALVSASEILVSLLSKHSNVVSTRGSLTRALNSLKDIEYCLSTSSELSKREIEVCSRILYGLSSIGIALDLGIGEESVKTYRKRAYQRLNIGSPRELLMWYLRVWGEQTARNTLVFHDGVDV